MASNYAAIIQANLQRLFTLDLDERAEAMGAGRRGHSLTLTAFGAACRIDDSGLSLDGVAEEGPRGIIISLYALHAVDAACRLEPLKSFKEMPDSGPYAGAFVNRTEQALAPAASRLAGNREKIFRHLSGGQAPAHVAGDVALVVRPLPKIALCYVCYLADEDFPAGVTCLYSNNADAFLPTDALADVGEYTTQTILKLLETSR